MKSLAEKRASSSLAPVGKFRRLPCYQPGDRGTVWRGPTTTADGIDDYLLTVDRNQDRNAIFTTDEVDPFV